MSNTKMLIDATHPEETRVVVQRNGRVEEFDFESAARKLLRGSIYLAKVTRVEPSLQAAFVDYGGNRHGFLAFNEIHPDYYQIPVADRQALIDEEAAAEAELEAAADRRAEALSRRSGGPSGRRQDYDQAPAAGSDDLGDTDAPSGDEPSDISHIIDVEEDEHIEEVGGDGGGGDAPKSIAAAVARDPDTVSEQAHRGLDGDGNDSDDRDTRASHAAVESLSPHHHEAEDDEAEADDDSEPDDAEAVDDSEGDAAYADASEADVSEDGRAAPEASESRGSDRARGADFQEEAPARQHRRPRSYKIQEVIKRRQVILVQVVKEERGNKGAALTTYLSLAGRYTVLMPNTARGGGISRKITNPQDRKRLKSIASELEVPEGMGLIIRTAGAARTKQEIKRDFEYLLRLWESVRDLTLQSTAPALVYEEGDLIKRSIRDLYNKDVEEVVVAGDAGYQEAAAFMRMLMPSHSKNVVDYKDPTPLFTKYGVERQLNAMFLPQVTLRSGGYIVINQTEALVAIDVNSGKSTREFSIEETALATNLEASDEIARQLKLRDLAGLIVIDFIDMEENRNNRAVERRLKDALRFDRARIQLGRISHFGLMEMSRQRLRTGVLEGSTTQCAHCQGTGIIRSTESVALAVLRGLEDAITAGAHAPLIATTTPAVALYILNSKRAYITEMEVRHGHAVTVVGSDRIQGANFTVERGAASAIPVRRPERAAVNMDWGFEGEGGEEAPDFEGATIETVGDAEDGEETPGRESRGPEQLRERGDGEDDGGRGGRSGGRRRGRGRGGRDRGGEGRERGGESRGDGRRGEFRTSRGPAAAGDSGGDGARFAADSITPRTGIGGNDAGDIDVGDTETAGGEPRDLEGRTPLPKDGNDDRPGRRRRRGRRGGRRGRDRDGTQDPLDAAADGDGNGADGEALRDVSEPNGFGQQPGIEGSEQSRNEGGGRSERRPARRPERNAERNSERHSERQRPDRIWDVPSAASAAAPVAAHAAAPVSATTRTPEPEAPRVQPEAIVTPGAAPARRRHETGSSEPRIERVVVRPDVGPDVRPDVQLDQAAATPGDATAAPQRKGWWQRTFSGE